MKPEDYAANMREAELQENVRQLALTLGIRYYHTYDSRRSDPGFPDLVLAGPRVVLFRELKSERGRATAAQADWLSDLHGCMSVSGIWRPSDWLDGRIQRELFELKGAAR